MISVEFVWASLSFYPQWSILSRSYEWIKWCFFSLPETTAWHHFQIPNNPPVGWMLSRKNEILTLHRTAGYSSLTLCDDGCRWLHGTSMIPLLKTLAQSFCCWWSLLANVQTFFAKILLWASGVHRWSAFLRGRPSSIHWMTGSFSFTRAHTLPRNRCRRRRAAIFILVFIYVIAHPSNWWAVRAGLGEWIVVGWIQHGDI